MNVATRSIPESLKKEVPEFRPVEPGAAPAATPEHRETMIAEAAYYRAEKRGFAPGAALEDWLAAEEEIDALIEAAV